MWEKKEESIKEVNYMIYRYNSYADSSNLKNIQIKEFLFYKSNDNYSKCIINFLSPEMADDFFETFLPVSPVYMYDPSISNNSQDSCYYAYKEEELMLSCVRFNLSAQRELDLDEICKFLRSKVNCLSEDILEIIKSKPRQLSDLEKNFYAQLPSLNEKNFGSLLKMAKKISFELLNANALWELADFTENKLSPPLIDKCIETLTCINPGLNYYFKALLKLTDFTLIKLADPQISIVEQREWVKNGLSWAFNIHSGGIDIAQKISLSLLNKNLLNDNPEIFPVTKKTKSGDEDEEYLNYIVNLLMYVKFLQKENFSLRLQNNGCIFDLISSKQEQKQELKSKQGQESKQEHNDYECNSSFVAIKPKNLYC